MATTYLAASARFPSPSAQLAQNAAYALQAEGQNLAPSSAFPTTAVPMIYTDGASSWNIGNFGPSFTSINFVVVPMTGAVPTPGALPLL